MENELQYRLVTSWRNSSLTIPELDHLRPLVDIGNSWNIRAAQRPETRHWHQVDLIHLRTDFDAVHGAAG
jgi:hypothetical protein